MAKQYEAFKKDFATLKKGIVDAVALDLTYRTNYQKQRLTMLEGAAEIGLRVQQLKDQGRVGNAVTDFDDDDEIEAMLKVYKEFADGLAKMYAVLKPQKTTLAASLTKFRTDLGAEIKSRKKESSTKKGTGNKSLPDMETLLGEADDLADRKDVKEMLTGKLTSDVTFRATVDKYIVAELAKTRAEKLSDFQQMMQQELLSLKNLSARVNRTIKQVNDLSAAGVAARKAVTDNQAGDLKTAQDQADDLLKLVLATAAEYEKAMADNWIKNSVEQSKDKAKIEKGLDAFKALKKRAKTEAKTIAELQLQ